MGMLDVAKRSVAKTKTNYKVELVISDDRSLIQEQLRKGVEYIEDLNMSYFGVDDFVNAQDKHGIFMRTGVDLLELQDRENSGIYDELLPILIDARKYEINTQTGTISNESGSIRISGGENFKSISQIISRKAHTIIGSEHHRLSNTILELCPNGSLSIAVAPDQTKARKFETEFER